MEGVLRTKKIIVENKKLFSGLYMCRSESFEQFISPHTVILGKRELNYILTTKKVVLLDKVVMSSGFFTTAAAAKSNINAF